MKWLVRCVSRGLAAALGWFERSRSARAILAIQEIALAGAAAWLAGRFFPAFRTGWSHPWSRPLVVALFWLILLAAIAARARRNLLRRHPEKGRAEIVRRVLVGVAALWLLRGLTRPSLHGASDAAWYATLLADMTAQARAGVFPVWLGQSPYQFNGSIYPLRIAPAFQYLGALLDALTAHSLGVYVLQNLLLTLLGVATAYSAYFCLGALLPRHRWLALLLALLFASCPGVLGIAYNSDLFMSWTTLPWIPPVWYATVRSLREDGGSPRTLALLGAALGLCWWGHAPIALWSTLLAAAAQLLRLLRLAAMRLGPAAWKRAALATAIGGLAFAAVAAYPIGSVLLYPPRAGLAADDFQRADPGNVVLFLRQVFPATLRPLSAIGRALSDFQLGYALWLVWLFCILGPWRVVRRWETAFALLAAALLALLLFPVPGLDLKLWAAVPAFVRNTTGNWAMNRLYVPLAAAVVFGAAAAAAAGLLGQPWRRRAFTLLAAAGCAWSFAEAAKFAAGSAEVERPAATAATLARPENVQITRFAYLVFPRLPDNFTNGVTDPALENRLVASDLSTVLADDLRAARALSRERASGEFGLTRSHAPDQVRLDRPLTLVPGRHYLLDFELSRPLPGPGVLQLFGPSFHREYALPAYGGPESFGVGGAHVPFLPVWTTALAPEAIVVNYVPTPAPADIRTLLPFARIRLLEYDPAVLPVRVDSWIPYRARIASPASAWLETPRMYQDGYVARVDGRAVPVRPSADGRACLPVPAGGSTVELLYRAPFGLQTLFWLSLTAIAAAASLGVRAWGPGRF